MYCASDFNECSVANECDKLYGTCIDIYPASGKLGYKCQCKTGYVGDGFICTGMHGANSVCTNKIHSAVTSTTINYKSCLT